MFAYEKRRIEVRHAFRTPNRRARYQTSPFPLASSQINSIFPILAVNSSNAADDVDDDDEPDYSS